MFIISKDMDSSLNCCFISSVEPTVYLIYHVYSFSK